MWNLQQKTRWISGIKWEIQKPILFHNHNIENLKGDSSSFLVSDVTIT